MVRCKTFEMWSMSISQFFGKTPLVKFICGHCNHYSEGRMSVSQVRAGDPYLACKCCGTVNYIPIEYSNPDDSDWGDY